MIVIGYQGIGKSTYSNKDVTCIDLESGNFWVDGVRLDDWYKVYCNIANHLSKQGYTVFVSSHQVVRDELKKSDEQVCIVYPSHSLKAEWVQRLYDRYYNSHLDKDYKAWRNAEERYDENIDEMISDGKYFSVYEIKSMDYNVNKIVETLKKVGDDLDV